MGRLDLGRGGPPAPAFTPVGRLMPTTLDPTAAALADAVRALEQTLADTRAGWDDSARRTFDSQPATGHLRFNP